jgi:1-pyrroline-4-hydroxy-2-carboxylate deaminase
MSVDWRGVIPAITTPFLDDLAVDHAFLGDHAAWLVDAGCVGIVPCGSLGEAATLSPFEKLDAVRTLVAAVGERVPVIPGVAALATSEAVAFARDAAAEGAAGLMVLPPYAYRSAWREMRAHVAAILEATDLPCLLSNDPVAYGTDFVPEQVAELAGVHANLMAIKESSTDVRRVTALRALLGDRLEVLVGVDDLVVEGLAAGSVGWIAGLVNAFPHESVRLFELARAGRRDEVETWYRWFLPLLRLDTVPAFVQLIKAVQAEVGHGRTTVRPPRLELEPETRERVRGLVRIALDTRPTVA